MAPFSNSPEDLQRLDWGILRDGGIGLYWRRQYLTEDVQWLKAHDYDIYEFDCEQWQSQDAMYSDIERVLRFSDWWGPEWGRNFNALDDCLGDFPVREDGGAALVFHRFNVYASGCGSALMSAESGAVILLDILMKISRFFLLTGRRFVTLVQTENPEYYVGRLGGFAPSWNRREWLNSKRTPESREQTS